MNFIVPQEESIIQPLSDLERAINNTSANDFFLFIIALNQREKEENLNKSFENKEREGCY